MSVTPKIYIAYHENDKASFEAFELHLKAKPFEVYTKAHLEFGTDIHRQTQAFLEEIDLFVMMISRDFIVHQYPEYEQFTIANKQKVRTVQLRSYDLIGDLHEFQCLHYRSKWLCAKAEKEHADDHYIQCCQRIKEFADATAAKKALENASNTTTDNVYVLVVSTTKNDLDKRLNAEVKTITEKIYGEKVTDWTPYLTDNARSIGTILQRFKQNSKLNVQILPSSVYEKEQLLRKEKSKIIAIVDCLALECDKEADFKQDLARIFNEPQIGGLLMPVCHKINEATGGVLSKMSKRIFRSLRKLYYETDDYATPYLHIELNVPSENDLLRKLINVANYAYSKIKNPKHFNWTKGKDQTLSTVLVEGLHSFGDL